MREVFVGNFKENSKKKENKKENRKVQKKTDKIWKYFVDKLLLRMTKTEENSKNYC